MIVLLDSSNKCLTVGIATNKEVIDSISYEAWQTQSEHMIPELFSLMKKHNLTKDDIEGIILSNGPGSYTGVRISLTIAKTMATVLNAKVYPVSSLRVLKHENNPSICLLNARSERSYFGVYEGEKIIKEDCIIENEDLKKYIDSHKDYELCGDLGYLGLVGYKSDIAKEMISLLPFLKESENPLGIKPAYMKD